jgi:hypothetical protein
MDSRNAHDSARYRLFIARRMGGPGNTRSGHEGGSPFESRGVGEQRFARTLDPQLGEGGRTSHPKPRSLVLRCPFVGQFFMGSNLLIPQVRPVHKYPIPPWEMIHLPLEDNALCAPPNTVCTDVCNKSLTATYQYKISNPSNKGLVNNN